MAQYTYLNNSDSDEAKVQKINSNLNEIKMFEARLTKGLIELPNNNSGGGSTSEGVWGSITGDINDQSDWADLVYLQTQLATRVLKTNTIPDSNINALPF